MTVEGVRMRAIRKLAGDVSVSVTGECRRDRRGYIGDVGLRPSLLVLCGRKVESG